MRRLHGNVFSGQIAEWTDDDRTAILPRCGIDSVIGSSSGFPITPDFLARMHKEWFDRT